MAAVILWLRQDLRLADHPALNAAMASGAVLPVFIWDEETPGHWQIGAAQKWWLHHSLVSLGQSFEACGNRLILRRGRADEILQRLAAEVGAAEVHALRHYEPWHEAAQEAVGARLALTLHDGQYLAPPTDVLNGQGQRYRMFTPWYRKLLERMPPEHPLPAPSQIDGPDVHVASDDLDDWGLLPSKPDWSTGFSQWRPGEAGAWAAWEIFAPELCAYERQRDFPSHEGTSRLSPHLHFGEISSRALWHALEAHQGTGPSVYRSQLAWREHGANLTHQMPHYGDSNGRAKFDPMKWREGPDADADFRAWCQGRTGYPVVDAGMRQLWQTGWMHNRVRMICASFLAKHLLIDWRRGERWFWDTLLDADYGANAANWQYVAGTGVDAPMFSRIMSPRLQSEKFDMADYIRQFVPQIARLSDKALHEAHLVGAGVAGYPDPIVGHEAARARALAAWREL